MKLKYLLPASILLTQNVFLVESCLCSLLIAAGKFTCPSSPTCCESGFYAYDECGCCLKCAKAELQTCGGASGILGKCAQGLQCLKTCKSCKTVGSSAKPCIFPFTYADRTYDKCITRDSDTGQPWCATEVDADGWVVDHAWGDCDEGCPGTQFECDDSYFSIQEGKCIDVSVPGAIPNWFGAPVVKLLDPTERLVPAPRCLTKGKVERLYDNTCRCARGNTAVDTSPVTGLPRGNCTGLEDDKSDNLEKVWCFLENVRDPTNPESGCYPDVKWSERDGRYWSSLACFESPDIEGGVKRQENDHVPDVSSAFYDVKTAKYEEVKEKTSTVPTSTTATTQKIPIPVFEENLNEDEFASVLNTIFKSANRKE